MNKGTPASSQIIWLEGEITRLRDETDEWERSHNTLVKEIERLREENARLRELLDDVFAQWDGDWPEDLVARVKAAISVGRVTGGP